MQQEDKRNLFEPPLSRPLSNDAEKREALSESTVRRRSRRVATIDGDDLTIDVRVGRQHEAQVRLAPNF